MSGTIKPLNSGSEGCSPVSSNCVIWQGPDITCLNLCKGDTVSDVMFQLGCLICTLKDQLDVDTYDLTCLNIATCDIPHTFREFMQFVIDKLCELETLTGESGEVTVAEQIVTVATCFSATLGPTATLSNYLTAIGQKVCELEITVNNQQTAIEQLIARIEVLEA